jgi:glycerate 2-kinase
VARAPRAPGAGGTLSAKPREVAEALFQAAIDGADPAAATAAAVSRIATARHQRLWLFSVGKAALAMATGAANTLQRSLLTFAGGLVVSPEPGASPSPAVTAVVGDHPVPGRNSFAAAARLADLAGGMKSHDLALVLISGGASSLIGAPLRGMSEGDFSHLFEMLLNSGLGIREVNAVRKRFSRWGGGRLALALAPATIHCLAISDVTGDDISSIGSGPCVADPYSVTDVIEILQRARLYQRLAPSFREHLAGTQRGVVPETPKAAHPAFAHVTARVIVNNRVALDAAAAHAGSLGIPHVTVADATLEGNAADAGVALARALIERRAQAHGERSVLVCGGETTVAIPHPTLTPALRGRGDAPLPPAPIPRGGRCQELALAAARVLYEAGDAARGITLLAAGTDGHDGPTDAAGGCVDARTWGAIQDAGRDPAAALASHESYAALDAAGALVRTGSTGTNVADVVIGLIDPAP